MKNIFAYTDAGGTYPSYISVNECGADFKIHVRSTGGQIASEILLSRERLVELANSINEKLSAG